MSSRKVKGSIFKSGHQPFAQALLKNRNIRVRSVGTNFFNASDFPVLYWMTGFAEYYKQHQPQKMHLAKHVLGAWDLREEEVTTNEDIVIASTPDWVTRKYRNILDGGLLHEMFHSLYTETGEEPDFDRLSEILQRQYDPEIPYHHAMRFIKHMSNIFEDGYIERHGMEKFEGAIHKIQTVHELVWEKEQYKRRYRPMDSPMVNKKGDPIEDDEGEPLVVKGKGGEDIPQQSMSLMGHIGCYLRDRVEDYLKRRPLDEYHPVARKIVDTKLDHIIEKGKHSEDSYDCLELALETLNELKDFCEELPEMPSGSGDGENGEEGEGEEGQGKTKVKFQVGKKNGDGGGDGNLDDLPDPEDVDEVEVEHVDDNEDDDDDDDDGEGGDQQQGDGGNDEGDGEPSEEDENEGEGQSEGSVSSDDDDDDDDGKEEQQDADADADADEYGDGQEQQKEGTGDDGGEDGEQDGMTAEDYDKLQRYVDKFPDMLKAFQDDEDLSSAIKQEWEDHASEDAPSSVLPFSRDYDEIIKIQRGNDRELDEWNKLEKEVRYETTYIRPRLLSYFRGKQKKRMRHRQRRGRRLSSRSVAEVVYKDRPRPFMNKTQTERKDSAVSLLLDESGSMGTLTSLARKILVTMALTIGELKIPMEVIGFTTGDTDAYQQYQKDYPNADVPSRDEVRKMFTRTGSCKFRVFREFDEQFSVQSYRKMMQTAAISGTPLASGIEFAARRLVKRPEEQKVLFIVTDGYPNSGIGWTNRDMLNIIRRQTEELRKDDVEVLFIGTADANFVDRFPYSMFIEKFDNFSQKMAQFIFEQMKRTVG